MENPQQVEISKLVDLLAEQTALYSKMLSSGASHFDFENCRERIEQLQAEIALRKQRKDPAT